MTMHVSYYFCSPMSAQEQQATQESADTHADSDTLVHNFTGQACCSSQT